MYQVYKTVMIQKLYLKLDFFPNVVYSDSILSIHIVYIQVSK